MDLYAKRIKNIEPIGESNFVKIKLGYWTFVEEKGKYKVGDIVVPILANYMIPRRIVELWTKDSSGLVRVMPKMIEGCISEGILIPAIPLIEHECYRYQNIITHLEYYTRKNEGEDGSDRGYRIDNLPSELDDLTQFRHKYEDVKVNWDNPIYYRMSPTVFTDIREYGMKDEDFKWQPYYITTKLPGYNLVCIKTSENTLLLYHKGILYDTKGKNIFNEVAYKYELLKKLPVGMKVEGEVVGPGVLNNPIGLPDLRYYIFNYGRISDSAKWMNYPNNQDEVTKLGLKFVPVEEFGMVLTDSADKLLKRADGTYPNGKPKEGIVLRSWTHKKHYKIINMKYLLQESGETQ